MSKSYITQPVLYVSHGGGPLPLLGQQPDLASFLSNYAQSLPAPPSMILIITAHWITRKVTVSAGQSHPLLFDYSGFPIESYEYTYPAPGSPVLASQIYDLLSAADIPCEKDFTRGWDHGVFVPLKLMFPKADIPVVAMSIVDSLDPLTHLKIGKAIAPLRKQGVLIIGSGMSFHNFSYFFTRSLEVKARGVIHSKLFDEALTHCFNELESFADEPSCLVNWQDMPSATEAHPPGKEEHLIPLHVVCGARTTHGTFMREVTEDRNNPSEYKRFGFTMMDGFVYSSFEFS